MSTWQQLADELKTDPALEKLTEEQVEAIIDVLMITMHADDKVAFMEEAELEHMLSELPWINDKEIKIDAYIKTSVAQIKALEGEASLRERIGELAKVLPEAEVREKAYHMAVALAGADMEIHPKEHDVLMWLAESFEIPQEKLAILK